MIEAQQTDLQIDTAIEMIFSPALFKSAFSRKAVDIDLAASKNFKPYIKGYPAVYILYSTKSNRPEAYVGETTQLQTRMRTHLCNRDRKKLNKVVAIGCKEFHQSATYNIESNLISYLLADGKYVLQNKRQTSDSFTVHNYYRKKNYDEDLFRTIWSQLIEDHIVANTLDTIQNRDVFKLSPYKQLSDCQAQLVSEIVHFCNVHSKDEANAVFLVEGEAGTGKSVVLSCLHKQIADLARDEKSNLFGCTSKFLVNHTEQLKTYKQIARSIKGLPVNSIQKPTSFINHAKKSGDNTDITIVDEAHLLLTHCDAYNNFEENNQLEEIIKHSKITIIVYDEKQVLKLKSFWDKKTLGSMIKPIKNKGRFTLTEQFRMQANEQTQQWIDSFVSHKKLLPLPEYMQVQNDKHFEFRVFDTATEMHEVIKQKNDSEGLARITATFDYEHKKKKGTTYYVEEGDFKLPWNTTEGDITWAERAETIDEVGSIYTVQGFDLNYVGVILGPSITYDEKHDRIKVVLSEYKDTEAFKGRSDIPAKKIPAIKERIILNSVNVLMKRGIKGLYIYAHDEALRHKLASMQG